MFYVKRNNGSANDSNVVKQKIHLHIIANTHKQPNI